MSVAVLGPGGVGGLVAGALDRAGTPVVVLASELHRRDDLRCAACVSAACCSGTSSLTRVPPRVWTSRWMC